MKLDLFEYIKNRVKTCLKTLVFPEYQEERMYEASKILLKERLVKKIVFCGDTKIINGKIKEYNLDKNRIEILEVERNPHFEEFVEKFYELRKIKGISIDDAKQTMKNELYFGAMLVREGFADAMVAGAHNTTRDVVRSALYTIGVKKNIRTVSSFFIMNVPDCEYGEKGLFFFADCAVVPNPNKEQLADIGITTAESMKKLFDFTPRIAFLSFSTKGSSSHFTVTKVQQACEIAKNKRPDLLIDGELQSDAALDLRVAKKKAPNSFIAGKANILIFPDLNSGNISYKLTQYLAKAQAYGPILQGLEKPVNDLSRGCTVNDIVAVSCVSQILT